MEGNRAPHIPACTLGTWRVADFGFGSLALALERKDIRCPPVTRVRSPGLPLWGERWAGACHLTILPARRNSLGWSDKRICVSGRFNPGGWNGSAARITSPVKIMELFRTAFQFAAFVLMKWLGTVTTMKVQLSGNNRKEDERLHSI